MHCCSFNVVVVVVLAVFSVATQVNGKIPAEDSFDESFDQEESSNISPPTKDAIIDFINKLVNTGYKSSKIAVNRIEKANQKRRQLGDQIERLLAKLVTLEEEEKPTM